MLKYQDLFILLFFKEIVLKFKNKINLRNIAFITKSNSNLLSYLFSYWFHFSLDIKHSENSWSSHINVHNPPYRTNIYGKNSS